MKLSENPWIAMLRLARPSHWVKNIIVLLPLFFALRIRDVEAWWHVALATGAFCLVSSATYVLNDILDRQRDRLHPGKRNRPIAAGLVGSGAAGVEAVLLALAGMGLAIACGVHLVVIVAAFLALQILYSVYFKECVILDVMCIALGFVLRAVGGAVAIGVEPSIWLFICTFTICLFMGFCKRYNEVVTLTGEENAHGHRETLASYTPELLTHMITLSAGVALVGFLLYTQSDRTIENFGTNYLAYTFPLVVYGVFRFAMLSMQGRYSDPTDLILHDRPFQVTLLSWMAMAIVIVLHGQQIRDWLMSHG